LTSQSDERLVSLARAGHERAFAVIVERYRPELLVLARRLSSDGRGEDIVQQAFLSAFAALRSGAEVNHLRGWLYQIVRNAATRSFTPVCVPLDGATGGGETLAGATARCDTLEDIVQQRAVAIGALTEMARLPSRQRQAMVATALDGRPRAEIASAMGLSDGAVRQLVHRARAQLRTVVSAVTPWPVARWFAGGRPGSGSAAEMLAGAGAGAASSGGVALKLGALLASGTIATGAAVVDIHGAGSRPHRANARAAVSHTEHSRAARARVAAGRTGPSAVLAAATVAAVSTVHGGPSSRHRGARDDAGASLERHGKGEDSISTPSRRRGGDDGGKSAGSANPDGPGGGGTSSGQHGGPSGNGDGSSGKGVGTSGPGPSSGSDASSGGGGGGPSGSPAQADGGARPQAAPQPVAAAAAADTVSDGGGSSGEGSGDPAGHGGSGGGSGGDGGSGGGGGSGGRDGGSGSGH
jgi:RNA polymerase sigma factor (sigma-70 family)